MHPHLLSPAVKLSLSMSKLWFMCDLNSIPGANISRVSISGLHCSYKLIYCIFNNKSLLN